MSNLIQIEKFEVELRSAGTILKENSESVKKATEFGNSILDNFKKYGVNDQSYKLGNDYLTRIKKTVQTMNEKRKPITQFLTEIAKQFTSLENEISVNGENVPGLIKMELDKYAAEVARKNREIEQASENKKRLQIQLNELEADIKTNLNALLYIYIRDVSETIARIWENINLDSFDEISAELAYAKFDLPRSHFSDVNINSFLSKYHLVSADQIKSMHNNLVIELYPDFVISLNNAVDQVKESIVPLFDEKFIQLKELKSANETQVAAMKELARKQEEIRKADQLSLFEAQQKAEIELAENNKIAANITALYDTAIETEPAIKIKEVTEIEVKNAAGWIELLLFYFEKEGKSLSDEKLEKKFGFAKKFAEAYFIKHDVKITSRFLDYVETAKTK